MLILASRQQRTAAGDKDSAAIHPERYGSKKIENMEFLFKIENLVLWARILYFYSMPVPLFMISYPIAL